MNYVTKPIPKDPPAASRVERAWDSFVQYANNRECTVSLMTVLPGQHLSLQSHSARAELWIVIDDGAIVRLGEMQRECQAGEEHWIPANEIHCLSCGGNKPVRVLEVAFGNWQQADVTRYPNDLSQAGG